MSIKSVVIKPDFGSMLSFVVYNPLANVNDLRRGGATSMVYTLWLRSASWKNETGFNISAVVSTLSEPPQVLLKADVLTFELRAA